MPDDFAGNSLDTARSLSLTATPQTFNDFVGGSDLNDYYSITFSKRSSLNLSLTNLTNNADLQLLNSNGQVVKSSAKTGTQAESIAQNLNPGTYYIRVFPNGGDTDYTLTASAVLDSAGNTLNSARNMGNLNGRFTVSDFVGTSDTNDYIRFTTTAVGNLSLRLEGLTGNANLQLIKDVNGNGKVDSGDVLQTSANTGITAETINRTGLAAGTYFVRVSPSGGASTNYKLTATADYAGNYPSLARELGTLSGSTVIKDFVGTTDTRDLYKFNLSETGTVNLLLNGLTGNANLQLIDSGGINVLQVSSNTGKTAESITTQLSAGSYYIQVYPYSGANANNTLTTSVNYLPVQTINSSRTLNEGGTVNITPNFLQVADSDTPESQRVYTITTPTGNGILKRGDTPLTTNSTFTQQDISNNLISYQHNGSETTSDSFTFTVSDGANTLASSSFNFTVTPVNDAPQISTNAGLLLNEGATATITTTQLLVSDVDNTADQLSYSLTTATATGTLYRNNTALTTGQTFTQADINSGLVRYQHNGSETTSDSFTFTVSDGVNLGSTSFNITLTPVNDLTLYDGSLGQQNQTPNQQGWLEFGTVPAFLGTPATQTASNGVTNLETVSKLL